MCKTNRLNCSQSLLLFSATTEHMKGEGGYAYNWYINGRSNPCKHGLLAQAFSQAMSGTKWNHTIQIPTVCIKLGSQYDDRLPFHSFCIVPFGHLMFELFTNYRSLVAFPSLQFTLC